MSNSYEQQQNDSSSSNDESSSKTSSPAQQTSSLDGRTNLYGRPYCPGRPLSMEERTRIIQLHSNGMKVNAISKSLCISHGCVSKIISRWVFPVF
uniref:Paired domain-containing protein n=1 Tax=Caenorhabditis japonica TaxID=281687 RepID=A0A8R1EJC7_CAEJA